MAIPRSREGRLYYRCAEQRYEEAEILHRADKPTGAVYLAGYGVECVLKALILSVVPMDRTRSVLISFRGGRAHDYNWLRDQYRLNGGAAFPSEVNRDFTLVSRWSTDLRYEPSTLREGDADDFLNAAKRIMVWAGGRL